VRRSRSAGADGPPDRTRELLLSRRDPTSETTSTAGEGAAPQSASSTDETETKVAPWSGGRTVVDNQVDRRHPELRPALRGFAKPVPRTGREGGPEADPSPTTGTRPSGEPALIDLAPDARMTFRIDEEPERWPAVSLPAPRGEVRRGVARRCTDRRRNRPHAPRPPRSLISCEQLGRRAPSCR